MQTIQRQVVEFLKANPKRSFYPAQIVVVSPTGSPTLPSVRRAIAVLCHSGVLDKTFCPTRMGRYSFHLKAQS